MKIQKEIFLISYILYLLWAIAYVFLNDGGAKIDTLIFSVTVASTFFSISDFIYTKIDIDRRESDEEFTLYFLSKYAEEFYMKKIVDKYREDAEKKLYALKELLGEEELEKIFQHNLTKDEKTTYLNKVNDLELKKFLVSLIENKDVIDELNEDDDKQVVRILKDIKRRERLYFSIPNILMIIGLVSLLVFLTLRIKPVTKINNICTLGAFLSVISSLTLKECYKSNSLEKLAAEKKAIIRDINKSK